MNLLQDTPTNLELPNTSARKQPLHYDMMQNMSFIPTHCFIIVPARVIIIIIATIVTSSPHAVT